MQDVVGPGALVHPGVFASTLEVTLEGGATLLGRVLENVEHEPEVLQCESACRDNQENGF